MGSYPTGVRSRGATCRGKGAVVARVSGPGEGHDRTHENQSAQ